MQQEQPKKRKKEKKEERQKSSQTLQPLFSFAIKQGFGGPGFRGFCFMQVVHFLLTFLQGDLGSLFYLTLDVIESSCHVLSKMSWKDCGLTPFHESVSACVQVLEQENQVTSVFRMKIVQHVPSLNVPLYNLLRRVPMQLFQFYRQNRVSSEGFLRVQFLVSGS